MTEKRGNITMHTKRAVKQRVSTYMIDWPRATLILSFAVPFMIMFTLFIIRGIYPFGDRSFLFSDMYHQYMPFFSEFMEKIKAGEGLAYSYHVGIGSNFLALYVYYLASPLHWLAFLVPQQHLMEFMSYLVIVKIGLCGLTSCIYLRYHSRSRHGAILFFSCFYALSGFMAAYNWNIMWLDCVVLLPLIVMGLEKLVKEGKCTMYCVTLALSIFTNYYISIMICIFLVLYFLVLLLTEKRSLKILGNFAFFSLLAAGMAAILLVPEVFAILETDFGDMNFPETLKSYFSVLDMLARHEMCVSTERGLAHWPNIYCGAAVFLLMPMYALNHRISIRRKFGYLGLAGFMLVGFSTNMLDFIWHGMNYPDSLPARQSFIYILLIITMCWEAFRNMDKMEPKHILYGFLMAVGFLLFCEKFVDSDDFETGLEFLTLGFVTAYAILLYLYRTRDSRRWKEALAAVTFVIVVAEAGINTYNTSVGTTSRTQYLGQQGDYKALAAQAQELEEASSVQGQPFYRIEKFTRKTKNDATLAGFASASVFSSTMNSYVADLYKRLGMRYSKVYYGFDGATAFTSALLNVNYMFGENENEGNSIYSLAGSSGDISLYRCEQTLPFGYTAPSGYDVPGGFSGDGLKLQNQMVRELGVKGDLFTQVSSGQKDDDVKMVAETDGIYYAILTASGTKKVEADFSEHTRSFNDLKDGSVLYLGSMKQGESVTLSNGDKDDETPKISADVYVMDEAVLETALDILSENSLSNVAYDTTHVSGEIDLEEKGRLILSIPYEHGWTVTIDGEEVQPELFGGTLMAFDLEAGRHTLSMHYIPHGKYAGIAVSVVSIGIFVFILWRKRVRGGKNKEEAETIACAGDEAEVELPEERDGEGPGLPEEAGEKRREVPEEIDEKRLEEAD